MRKGIFAVLLLVGLAVGAPATAEDGRGLGLTLLSATLMFEDLGITTTQGNDVDGKINFTGRQGPTTVQILGPTEDVSTISVMAAGLNEQQNAMLNLLRMNVVLGKVFPDWPVDRRAEWLGQVIGDGGGETVRDGRLVRMTVVRKMALATMSIEAAE